MGEVVELPAAPDGLRDRGGAFWREVLGEYALSPVELETLRQACAALDRVDALEEAIGRDGVTVTGSTGQVAAHPCIREVTATVSLFDRLVKSLDLPDAEEEAPKSAAERQVSESARRAANARWDAHRSQKAAGQ